MLFLLHCRYVPLKEITSLFQLANLFFALRDLSLQEFFYKITFVTNTYRINYTQLIFFSKFFSKINYRVAAELTTAIYYMVCSSAILTSCRESSKFRRQTCRYREQIFATLSKCSITCIGFLFHSVLILRFNF